MSMRTVSFLGFLEYATCTVTPFYPCVQCTCLERWEADILVFAPVPLFHCSTRLDVSQSLGVADGITVDGLS